VIEDGNGTVRVGLPAAAFRPAFWFARKRYHIYRADSDVILGAKLPKFDIGENANIP
jgi:hypothetical protein